MDSLSEVMSQLKKLGNPQSVKIYSRHGAPENMFGVKVGDLKPIAKKLKGQQKLALELYETGNADAMYLAGLVAEGSLMTKSQIESWARAASWYMLSEYTVAWVASESKHGRALALKWMNSRKESIASSGWSTYALILAMLPDEELDLEEITQLLERVESEIESAPNRVRYTMNGFVISVGAYVKDLSKRARQSAQAIGKVSVDMGDTACKVPLATEAIDKIVKMGRVGKKRATAKC